MKTTYETWFNRRIINTFYIISIAFLLVEFFFGDKLKNYLIQLILALILLTIAFAIIYVQFCQNKLDYTRGNLLEKYNKMLIKKLNFKNNGTLLHWGCKNGALTIMCAKALKRCHIIGADTFKRRDQSLKQCIFNAQEERLTKRVEFRQDTLSDYRNNQMDGFISSYTLTKNQSSQELIQEALRITRKGGSFALMEKFENNNEDIKQIISTLKKEYHYIRYIPYSELKNDIPWYLRSSLFLKGTGIVYGTK